MTDTELLHLRREVRRDGEISDSAARLFAEIADLSMLEDGCYAGATQLGAWLGMSERTIRRRRQELIDAGYLRAKPCQNGRKLIPVKSDGQQCPTKLTDKSDQRSKLTDKTGQNGADKSGQHKENNNTHESERARTHEELFGELVSIWRQTSGTPPFTKKHEDTFWRWAKDEVITDLSAFQEALEQAAESTAQRDVNLSLGVLRKEYQKELDSGVLSPKRQEDSDWSVIDGEPAYKGVPISEMGPQKLN